eukprot:TRINITY_DN2119_c0_g1_i1.p1 TRINITY_DN2119_c0_g1~~TRINITY_DN2119_c0_g1_i1.p1  ORF type:complete len:681 (-),score=198.45 TRINITY_DN2119_c0_g1_i1:1881-3923(-)
MREASAEESDEESISEDDVVIDVRHVNPKVLVPALKFAKILLASNRVYPAEEIKKAPPPTADAARRGTLKKSTSFKVILPDPSPPHSAVPPPAEPPDQPLDVLLMTPGRSPRSLLPSLSPRGADTLAVPTARNRGINANHRPASMASARMNGHRPGAPDERPPTRTPASVKPDEVRPSTSVSRPLFKSPTESPRKAKETPRLLRRSSTDLSDAGGGRLTLVDLDDAPDVGALTARGLAADSNFLGSIAPDPSRPPSRLFPNRPLTAAMRPLTGQRHAQHSRNFSSEFQLFAEHLDGPDIRYGGTPRPGDRRFATARASDHTLTVVGHMSSMARELPPERIAAVATDAVGWGRLLLKIGFVLLPALLSAIALQFIPLPRPDNELNSSDLLFSVAYVPAMALIAGFFNIFTFMCAFPNKRFFSAGILIPSIAPSACVALYTLVIPGVMLVPFGVVPGLAFFLLQPILFIRALTKEERADPEIRLRFRKMLEFVFFSYSMYAISVVYIYFFVNSMDSVYVQVTLNILYGVAKFLLKHIMMKRMHEAAGVESHVAVVLQMDMIQSMFRCMTLMNASLFTVISSFGIELALLLRTAASCTDLFSDKGNKLLKLLHLAKLEQWLESTLFQSVKSQELRRRVQCSHIIVGNCIANLFSLVAFTCISVVLRFGPNKDYYPYTDVAFAE